MPLADAAFLADQPAVRAAIAQLEAAIGGRANLVHAFLAAPPDPDRDLLLGLIADPRNDHRALASLCEEAGLTAGELLRLYKQAAVATAQVLAIHEVAAAAPAVTADVMRRAQNHYRLCSACAATGQVWEPILDAKGKPTGDRQKVVCGLCEGSGQVLAEASLDHQKLALDMAGMLQKAGPSTLVQVDASQTATLHMGALPFAQLQKAVQKVLDPPTRPIPPTPPTLPAATPPDRFAEGVVREAVPREP